MDKHCEFEFGKLFHLSNRNLLEKYLIEIWQRHVLNEDYEIENSEDNLKQSFFSFDGNQAKARNYIGFVQTEDCHIEIYPKVFKKMAETEENKKLFLQHIFYWFDYCQKWKFPFTNVNLDLFNEIEFPELIINLMAEQILGVISNTPVSLYQEVEESFIIPRGKINFNRYIARGLTNGNPHTLECDYEPLLFDNTLNRVIKYVTRILERRAKFDDTKQKLNEIVFILDEVEDMPCTVNDLNSIKLNSFFFEYRYVIDICRMVLEQQIYSNEHYEQSQWCLLFPMEYIFEDFVAGFLEAHFSDKWEVHPQKSELNLSTDPPAFQMRHDILLTLRANKTKQIIVDTKYKLRHPSFKEDPKKGIAQSDMYQMTSYAMRRGCKQVLLLYPNYSEIPLPSDRFTIKSGFSNALDEINVIAAEIPFWSMNHFNKERLDNELKKTFSQLLNHFS